MLPDSACHAVFVSCTDEIADQWTTGWGKCHHYHEQNAGYAPDNVRDGERPFSQMLYIEEEQEPGGQGEDVLYHGPEGNVQHAFQYFRAELRNTVQSKLTAVNAVEIASKLISKIRFI